MMESDQSVPSMTKGEQTRRKIVEHAAPIFNRQGYQGSSLSDLMAATGLKKGGIYRHFSSKEELAAEVFDYTWETALQLRLKHVDQNSGGLDRLKQTIASFVEHRSPIAGGCPILNTAIDSDDGNPVLRTRVSKALRSWVKRLQAMVAEAAEHGDVRPGVEPKAVATFVVATLEGALMISRIERNDQALRTAQEQLNQYLDNQVSKARQEL